MKLVRLVMVLAFGALVGFGGFFTISGGHRPSGTVWMTWYMQPEVQVVIWSVLGYSASARVLRLFRTQAPEPPEGDLRSVLENARRPMARKIGELIYLSWCSTVGLAAAIGFVLLHFYEQTGIDFHARPAQIHTALLIAFVTSIAGFAAFAIWVQRQERIILEQYELENQPPGMVIVRPPFVRD